MRQQAENLVQVSYQSLRDAMSQQEDRLTKRFKNPTEPSQPSFSYGDESERHNTTQWLYELVYSSYAESLSGSFPTSLNIPTSDEEVGDPDGFEHTNGVSSMELTAPISKAPEHMHLAAMIQKPVEVPSVVDELLAEWTTLSEDEIAGVVLAGPGRVKPDVPIVKFKDALGRIFDFPYQKCRTWSVSYRMDTKALKFCPNIALSL